MIASIGFMPLIHLVQEINLPDMTFTPLLFLLIPILFYMLISRLRYLGKLRIEHENILEASLSAKIAPPLISAKEKSKEKEHTLITNEQPLFPTTFPTPLQSKLKAS